MTGERALRKGERGGFTTHHKSHRGDTDVWLTPPHILETLGPFDLDPCAPEWQPWRTAHHTYTEADNGLIQPWNGFVWLNPPYGPEASAWLNMLADHGNGIAIVFARTETKSFFDNVWRRADALLFLQGRLTFYRGDGTKGKANAGAPSVLVGYGPEAKYRLRNCDLAGAYIEGFAAQFNPTESEDK